MKVVIGLGNDHRRDDGIGPAVAAALAADCPPGVRVLTCAVEPAAILDAWEGAELAVLIDAVRGSDAVPGRIRRCAIDELADPGVLSSHGLNLSQTYELARVLDRAPQRVVVIGVDAADTGYGAGLSAEVAQAVPEATALVLDELSRIRA
ncbi:MAG: hydrogenase maturation protease [Mycobacterium sp.]|nr:MAG: hydrogenase maturation protease [Mycobacterium sp.]